MLDIPFIGAYRIQTAAAPAGFPTIQVGTANFLEINSLPMDSAFADDQDSTDDIDEAIGRFVPIQTRPVPTANPPASDYYGWTRNLFNYLTVRSGNDDYLPNIDPGFFDAMAGYSPSTPAVLHPAAKYPPESGTAPYTPSTGLGTSPFLPANPIFNSDATASDQTAQHKTGIEGLININTASWKVLSMLPFVTPAEDVNWQQDNELIAKTIVAYRDGGIVKDPGGTNYTYIAHGPFLSIFDLNSVSEACPSVTPTGGTNGFQNAWGKLFLGTTTTKDGLMGPPDPLFPGVTITLPLITSDNVEDFQQDNAVLTRISNLVTTRSDTFTVYVVVEGWQNAILPGQTVTAGTTPPAQLKVTRRFSFIADRSQVNGDPTSRFLHTTTVPQN